MSIAVIPARGGSKRIPKKNIREFFGKPMLAWSILAAQKTNIFEKIIVSTDDLEIKKIAEKYGAEVPFLRPKELSSDHAATAPVIAHAIKKINLKTNGDQWVCCIYPCAPLIFYEDIKNSLELVQKHKGDFIYPISDYAVPPQWALRLKKNNHLEYLNPGKEMIRSQDLEKLYFDAGQFYWGKASAWIEKKEMHSSGIGYPIKNSRAVDIDTLDDWKRAEALFKHLDIPSLYL